ncbi:type VI secretion protein [Altererythrobacter salegens]|uniref:Type VI secretion protein n=1 Tax=Croceibacterium salegens TaxID=1737568 RepID=A0A6I4SVC7_9SPHN|nr:type IV secretion system protein [Croceibacterium salegens]MXO59985.1 type VI secretion protein [Croceibacterium salegens]
MSAAACQRAVEQVGSGIAASLQGVDCAASGMAQAAFSRLFGSGGSLVPALTILLTLYVALFAFALITGRSRVGVSSLTPRIVTLGLVLTFATSWIAYQSVVWNLATGAPNQIAAILTGTPGNATMVFAQKIDVVFEALIQASGGQASPDSAFSPPGLLWLGGTLFLLGTVGLLATTRIALAILLAIGPVFVVFALFPGTRGLFVGWLKGVVMLAIAPLFAVLGGSMMLELSVPVLSALVEVPGQIDAQAAMAFFMIAAVYIALMFMTLKVAATMVNGWSVFGLANGSREEKIETAAAAASRPIPAIAPPAAGAAVDQARYATAAPSREIRLASAAPLAANNAGGAVNRREVRVSGTSGQPSGAKSISRASGVGSRFRSPAVRKTEKMK